MTAAIIRAIEAQCDWDGDCLVWRNGVNSGGHPVMCHQGKTGTLVRRVLTAARREQPIPTGMVMRPVCGNKRCMADDHCRLLTRSQTMANAGKLGALSSPGKRANCHISARKSLTPDQVREIMASPETVLALAARFNVSHTNISRIKRGESWRAINPMAGLLS